MRLLRLWLPAVIWMGVIFTFSTRQRLAVSDEYTLNFLFFKSLHVIEYAVLFVLLIRATRGTWPKFSACGWLSLLLVIAYAVSDEVHQTFVPTREGALRDVIIDAIGASTAWIILIHGVPHLPAKLQKLVKKLVLI